MDKITEHLRGRSNAGLRRIVRAAAHEPNRGIGYDSAAAIADRIGRRVALTPSGRANVLAALRALERDCFRWTRDELVALREVESRRAPA